MRIEGIESRETCVLMGPFGKYLIFETQLYKIWEPNFNMESNIAFMHFELAPFFVPRLPSSGNNLGGNGFWLRFSDAGGGFLFGFFLHAGVRSEEDESVLVVAIAPVEEFAELPPFWWSHGVVFPTPSRWRLYRLGFPHAVLPRRHFLELVGLRWRARSHSSLLYQKHIFQLKFYFIFEKNLEVSRSLSL